MQQEVLQTYHWVENNGHGYLQLPLLHHSSLFHFFGTRLLSSISPKNGSDPVALKQVHEDRICHVGGATGVSQDAFAGLEGDALATDTPNLLLTVSTADCLPVLLFDPQRKVVSAIHAGWRGSVLNIAGKAVAEMASTYGSNPRDLLAGIGPSIGRCCFIVKEDVVTAIETKCLHKDRVLFRNGGGRWRVDLTVLNRLQLIDAGLTSERIASTGLCTSCLSNLFYSYRREKKKTGGMLSGIMLV